jgi:hypothetical protein
VADRCIADGLYVTDFLADKSAGRSVPVKIRKLRIDRTQLTYMENNQNQLGLAESKNPKI